MLKDKLYEFFVRRHSGVRYEYERYVQEHIVEHYENRMRHLKILFKLNWHYRVKKLDEPMIYFDYVDDSDVTEEIVINNVSKNEKIEEVKNKKHAEKNTVIKETTTKNSPGKSVQGNLPYLQGAESRSKK